MTGLEDWRLGRSQSLKCRSKSGTPCGTPYFCLAALRSAFRPVKKSRVAAMQMQEWIEKSKNRSGWMVGGAFLMAGLSLLIALYLLVR